MDIFKNCKAWAIGISQKLLLYLGGMEAELLLNTFYISYYCVKKMEYLTKIVTLYFETLSHFVKISRKIPPRI
jgi:hypothetical protein